MYVKEPGGADRQTTAVALTAVTGLSERQLQILGMLRDGKVNKEIANELGIGLGTVKQHVVALFKKLNVRNRAMAVSRGADLLHESRKRLPDQGLIEYRPCVVLSFVLDGSGENLQVAGRHLQQTMAACAFDLDAIFLARQQNGGDLIFGIQGSSESMVLEAIGAAHQVAQGALASDELSGIALHGGIEVGLAVASMYRTGGWSGDAIASSAIASARQLAGGSNAGTISVSSAVRMLFRSISPGSAIDDLPESLDLGDLATVPWCIKRIGVGCRNDSIAIGREQELARVGALLADARGGLGRTVYIEGETGMGKTTFCDAIVSLVSPIRPDLQWHRIVCHYYRTECSYYDLADGKAISFSDLATAYRSQATGAWLFDDCHNLQPEALEKLLDLVAEPKRCLVFLCGRRSALISSRVSDSIKLGRLPSTSIREILQQRSPSTPVQEVNDAVKLAMGVPLFAVEIIQHGIDPLPLSLRLVVGARLDRLKLDRLLLRQVAEDPGVWHPEQIARQLHENLATVRAGLERAVASGVLARDDDHSYSYSHPLLRQVVLQTKVE